MNKYLKILESLKEEHKKAIDTELTRDSKVLIVDGL